MYEEPFGEKPKYFSVDDRVETISKSWIPIQEMKGFARFNKKFVKNIDTLFKKHQIIG